MGKKHHIAERLRRGSMTVEAAFVVPLTFLILICLMTLLFYVHNRTWYRCAAFEVSIRANAKDAAKKGDAKEAAQHLAAQRIADQVMPGDAPEVSLKGGTSGTTVRYRGGTAHTFFGGLAGFDVQAETKKVRPERAIRLARAAKKR